MMAGEQSRTMTWSIKTEAVVLTHLRFADRELSYEERQAHLTALMQSYLSTMADIGAETGIMHGTLLGWWWNGKVSLLV